jgi:hypothetical protein
LSGGRFIATFAALSNRKYFDSCDGAGGFGKSSTTRVRYTIRLRSETQYKTHHEAVKMSFRRGRDFMPFLGLCQFASISIQKMVLTDLERGQQGE